MQLAEPAAGASARAWPLLEVKDLKTYSSTEADLVRAVNGVTFAVDEAEVDILDRVGHPRDWRECLVSAAICMSGSACG